MKIARILGATQNRDSGPGVPDKITKLFFSTDYSTFNLYFVYLAEVVTIQINPNFNFQFEPEVYC